MIVYLLHFQHKLHHAAHYCGSTPNLRRRLNLHATGRGARLTAHLHLIAEKWTLATILQCDTLAAARRIERQIKKNHNGPRYCPLCTSHPKVPAGALPIDLELLNFPITSESILKGLSL